MANIRMRPGPWKAVNVNAGTQELEIDYEKFEVPGNGTTEFFVTQMGLANDTYFKVYRNPVSTVQPSSSLGSSFSTDPSMGKKR